MILPRNAELNSEFEESLFGGVTTISTTAQKISKDAGESLYATNPGTLTATTVKAVPYALRGNKQQGEMLVWINET